MDEELSLARARAEWLERVLRERVPQESWTVHLVPGKPSLRVEAERGEMNQPGWLRTNVIIPLDLVESLDEDALVSEVRKRVAGYRLM